MASRNLTPRETQLFNSIAQGGVPHESAIALAVTIAALETRVTSLEQASKRDDPADMPDLIRKTEAQIKARR